ncbi:MAG: putative ABC transporter permease [Clostridia bacterium]|nr:putative ABC transporter permease [Clostridia bacterium]
MIYSIQIYFMLYIIYSVCGWILEVTCKFFQYKRFINRGFLLGPYCPIYGTGAIVMTLLLQKYIDDPVTLFIMAMLICSILEYATSYFMEKIFKARWWDYSTYRFNINGRVCLETTIPFGIFGFIIMYVTNPFILKYLYLIPSVALNILTIVIALLFIIDNIISFKVMFGVRGVTKEFNQNIKDNTEEITTRVKEILKNQSFLSKRLIGAFPGFESVKSKIKEKKSR